MQVVPFITDSVEDAVLQIRAQLGSDAVVLNVRQLPVNGLARFWRRPKLEILACRPDPPSTPSSPVTEMADGSELKAAQESLLPLIGPDDGIPSSTLMVSAESKAGHWRVGPLLEKAGLLSLSAQRVVDQLRSKHGESPPALLADELSLARAALTRLWRRPEPFLEHTIRPHVLLGPAGVGKTTCLCKWLTQSVLVSGRSPRVWRLDGATANKAESLSVYCEILGLEAERSWSISSEAMKGDLGFIDLPGVDWRDPLAIRALAEQLKHYLSPHLHLVLNAAYELPLLFQQLRAFDSLPVTDLIFTHLDEEARWGKLWNFVLGTNYNLRFFSAGQNIPGGFMEASAEVLLGKQFPSK
jgi:flagellar biosynthesis protein FlhF